MKSILRCIAVVFAFTLVANLSFSLIAAERPSVFLLDGERLHSVRTAIANGDKHFQPAIDALRRDADRALSAGPFSVVNKEAVPPAGTSTTT